MAKVLRYLGLLAGLPMLSCCCQVRPSRIETANLTQVLDKVKAEMNAYRNMTPEKGISGTCYNGKDPMDLIPTHAIVTLKTVSTHGREVSTGLQNPIGVLKIDPSVKRTSSRGNTQTVTVAFDVADYSPGPDLPGDHEIADALNSIRNQIIAVDHNAEPCINFGPRDQQVKKPPIKLEIAFEAKSDTTSGAGFDLVVLKLSDKEELSSDYVQTLELDLVSSDEKAFFMQYQ